MMRQPPHPGEAIPRHQQLIAAALLAGVVVGALPCQGPRRVPPRVDGGQCTAPVGFLLRHTGPAALTHQPLPKRKTVLPRALGRGEVAVDGGKGSGVVQAGREGQGQAFAARVC